MLPRLNLPHLLALCLAISVAPLALAHPEVGTPKLTCESSLLEASVHDYAHSAFVSSLRIDPWLVGQGAGFASAPTPVQDDKPVFYAYTERGTLTMAAPTDGSTPLACASMAPDGHAEWAMGGALLGVRDPGFSLCYGAYPDHYPGTLIEVYDAVLTPMGAGVTFYVYADTLSNLPPLQSGYDCGDFEADHGVECLDRCTPGILPGLDGAYLVFVSGTYGHVVN